jgi:hypothetical protein
MNHYDTTVLCVGDTGNGKTSSLRNMPLANTVYINVDQKPLPFKHKDLYKHVNLSSTQQMLVGMDQIEDDEQVEYCVVDTISYLGDMFYNEYIRYASDSRAMWGAYKDYLLDVINKAKKSRINYIFLAHAQDVYDEKEQITKTFARVQGSLRGNLEGHFTYVLFNVVKSGSDGMPEFCYLTNKTRGNLGVSAKTPMGMFDEAYIPNDITVFHEAVTQFHEGE